ncbi:MAG: hypothetical protein ABIA75_13955 [Candidatus Neomarinimicrobiota bacterium]
MGDKLTHTQLTTTLKELHIMSDLDGRTFEQIFDVMFGGNNCEYPLLKKLLRNDTYYGEIVSLMAQMQVIGVRTNLYETARSAIIMQVNTAVSLELPEGSISSPSVAVVQLNSEAQ